MYSRHFGILLLLLFPFLSVAEDARLHAPYDLDTARTFPKIETKEQWQTRAKAIREQVLVSCGLWPMPQKTPLNAKVFDKVERDGYSVEKVYLQPYPGYYLGGNLYRPLGKGAGPFPAILNPHGHWENGRLADTESGSIAARCINFAKQGMIAFSYDMAGYNDTSQIQHHRFATDPKIGPKENPSSTDPKYQLWNISLMGLQTWDSIRALDFLESLSDVDKARLACTGESGGGTQTFILGAIDDRLAAQGPIVMVSSTMQGGCLCENAPGLRVLYSNMEIAAAPAPRPQILVGATGDWTKLTMTVEGPSLQHVYDLLGATDHLRYVVYDYGHNYNKTSREAVYEWFGKWLLHSDDPMKLKEVAYTKEPDQDLLVFPDKKLPDDAISQAELITLVIDNSRKQLNDLAPKDETTLKAYQDALLPAWRHNLELEAVSPDEVEANRKEETSKGSYTMTRLTLGRKGQGEEVPAIYLEPTGNKRAFIAILVHPDGKFGVASDVGAKVSAKVFLDKGMSVLAPDVFLTGESARPELSEKRNYGKSYFTTYNRTDLQERVQDIATACAYARKISPESKVVICGFRRAGLWVLAAAPLADAVIADCAEFDSNSEIQLTSQDIFMPGLRKLGGFQGIAMLAAPRPILMHNAGVRFEFLQIRDLYDKIRKSRSLRVEPGKLGSEALADWVTSAFTSYKTIN
jgi:dienelactone hydrolase